MKRSDHSSLQVREMAVFAMLGSLMFCSKLLMEVFPNIHLLGMLTMTCTVVFRKKALIPIYIYVLLNGLYAGFAVWWISYLYIWTILWALTMLIPKNASRGVRAVIYPLLCGLHGFAYGILYAPVQAWVYGMNFRQMLAWIVAGIPFDLLHGVGNLCVGLLILPFSELLQKLLKKNRVL